MFDKSTVKLLTEHKLLDALENDSNKYQRLLRMHEISERGIRELTLLAGQIPKSIHVKIFTFANMEKLLKAVLEGSPDDRMADLQFEVEMSRISAMLIRECVKYCSSLYSLGIETDRTLNQTVLDKLTNAVELCEAIAFKTFIRRTESLGREESTHYLFNWDKITPSDSYDFSGIIGEDNWNLIMYLNKELDERIDRKARKGLRNSKQIRIEVSDRSKECYFLLENDKGYRCILMMKKDQSELKLKITDLEGRLVPMTYKKRLIVQTDSIKNYKYIFLHRPAKSKA
jgi:hypothetical protein